MSRELRKLPDFEKSADLKQRADEPIDTIQSAVLKMDENQLRWLAWELLVFLSGENGRTLVEFCQGISKYPDVQAAHRAIAEFMLHDSVQKEVLASMDEAFKALQLAKAAKNN